eukprot:228883_1
MGSCVFTGICGLLTCQFSARFFCGSGETQIGQKYTNNCDNLFGIQGGCCIPSGCCQPTTLMNCNDALGSYAGNGINCTQLYVSNQQLYHQQLYHLLQQHLPQLLQQQL